MEAAATREEAAARPWDGFLVGPENALAHASVLAMARGDEGAVSPLVVHGPSGSGKSRLLAGLVGEWVARRPGSAVAHLVAEEFVASCDEAREEAGGWAELRGRFRGLDLLVVEDLHGLGRSVGALEELGHTLDALDGRGAAVAASARVGPGHWEGWPRRLVSRFLGGLAVRVDPPGADSRRRYLREGLRVRGLRLPAEAVEAMAEAADGYRTIDGWLARVALEGKLGGGSAAGVSESVLAEAGGMPGLSVERIARDVAARFGVRVRDLRSASRHAGLVGPRHLAIHLARERTGRSFAALGAYFGGRDPKTVRHACRMAADRIAADPSLAAAVEALRRGWRADPAGGRPAAGPDDSDRLFTSE